MRRPSILAPVLLLAVAGVACEGTPTDAEGELPALETTVQAQRGSPGPPSGVGPPEGKGPPPGKGPAFFSRIAFASDRDGPLDIFVMDADGSNVAPLTFRSGGSDPAWSPDGARIAFAQTTRIWVMNADGSEPTALDPPIGVCIWLDPRHEEPTWSPDGTRVAYARQCGPEFDIFVQDVAGEGSTWLMQTAASSATDPAWSPDGSRIAYTSDRSGYEEIWAMDADGSSQSLLGPVDPACSVAEPDAREPAWSPDGTWIAFAFRCHGSFDIYLMDRDGSNLQRLTDGPEDDFEPAWSPDGRRIAFASGHPFSSSDIWVMNADGSSPTNLTEEWGGRNLSPSWQP